MADRLRPARPLEETRGAPDLTDLLRAAVRLAGAHAEPPAAVMDSQSVHESAEGVVPAATSGFDPFKKVNGRKRHLLAGTLGLLVTAVVTKSSAADCAVAPSCSRARPRPTASPWPGRQRLPRRRRLPVVTHGTRHHRRDRSARLGKGHGFQVLPRRWVVERTNAWITRRRRCARDYERLPAHHEAMIHWAAIIQLTRRLARTPAP